MKHRFAVINFKQTKTEMKKLILLIAIIMMASCSPVHTSIKNQRESVKYSKYHQKGFKKASKRINAYNSEQAYGRR
jgi:uncharacterized lipoprotein YajG